MANISTRHMEFTHDEKPRVAVPIKPGPRRGLLANGSPRTPQTRSIGVVLPNWLFDVILSEAQENRRSLSAQVVYMLECWVPDK